jgi:hypothetical protein
MKDMEIADQIELNINSKRIMEKIKRYKDRGKEYKKNKLTKKQKADINKRAKAMAKSFGLNR